MRVNVLVFVHFYSRLENHFSATEIGAHLQSLL